MQEVERLEIALTRPKRMRLRLVKAPKNKKHGKYAIDIDPFLRNYIAGLRPQLSKEPIRLCYQAPRRDIWENRRLCTWEEKHMRQEEEQEMRKRRHKKKKKHPKRKVKTLKSKPKQVDEQVEYDSDYEDELLDRYGDELCKYLLKRRKGRIVQRFFGMWMRRWCRMALLRARRVTRNVQDQAQQTDAPSPRREAETSPCKQLDPFQPDDLDAMIDEVILDKEQHPILQDCK